MASSYTRRDLDWILDKVSSSIGTGFPGRWWNHHSWRYLKDLQTLCLDMQSSDGLDHVKLMFGLDCKDTFHPKWLNDSIIIWSEDTEKREPDFSWRCSNGTRCEGHQLEHWNFQLYFKIIFLIVGIAKYRDRQCRDIIASLPLELYKTQVDELTWLGVLWAGN